MFYAYTHTHIYMHACMHSSFHWTRIYILIVGLKNPCMNACTLHTHTHTHICCEIALQLFSITPSKIKELAKPCCLFLNCTINIYQEMDGSRCTIGETGCSKRQFQLSTICRHIRIDHVPHKTNSYRKGKKGVNDSMLIQKSKQVMCKLLHKL